MSPPPLLASTREELADALAPRRRSGDPVALVPTMGALHDGHAALLRTARQQASSGVVVASVFVNPLQFAPGEDLDRYPRTFDDDLELCEKEGVDVVFAPSVDEVYPGGEPLVTVEPGPLAAELEGESRPGHFRGVLTVVAKLFGLTRPDAAFFGEKDYQQLVLVRRMSRDLCLGVEVVGVPTVREPDGLALSSRNRYLDPAERSRAVVLSRSLRAAAERAAYGLPAARWAAMRVLDEVPKSELDLDYLAIRTPDLGEVTDPHPATATPARVLVAARVGTTRLIDNLPITLGPVG
ncbi:MAG TPA: pantoate--beta-alanine ligase [Nocardioides sp.]|uniref:pantoate--beta-alanine ligase n=1 Tax=Nocardioides sp. TaxID=35761 RepID=UPI002F4231D0